MGGQVEQSSGSGFMIGGNRILTNAHVVSNARHLEVSKEGNPRIYPARILHVAHDCDLALITVDDEAFFRGVTPLEMDGIPAIESTVSVYGYPIGGDRLSVTRGVVSRIDFQPYSHSGVDSHLAIQIDAAINPGNSGGPVLQDNRVVGVAFQGFSGDVAQNVGYMIPTPVIRRFLADVEDGHYDRYVDLAISYHPLHNPAQRRALGLPDDDTGVVIGKIFAGGSSEGHLKVSDVILAIDGHPVASDGTVELDGDRMEMAEVVERKFRGDQVRLDILREGKPMQVTVPSLKPWPFSIQANAYDVRPRFLVFGGLVFQPLDANFMSAHDPEDLRIRYTFDHFLSHDLHTMRPEVIVLSNVLNDPVNAHLSEFRHSIVSKVNGEPVKNLDELAAALAKGSEFTVIELDGNARPLVLRNSDLKEANERIATRYGITSEKNLKE
ncbi:MAG: S1C family serine protease [Terrimicrobiaceae bacterium]